MGMFFTYNIRECNDYQNPSCKLNKRRGSIGKITKEDPNHWHLYRNECGDWVYKNMDACLAELCFQVRSSYQKIYSKGELS